MLVCSSKAGMLEILTKTKINGRMSALLIAQFIDVFVFDSLVVFLSCHLKAAGEKAQMTLRVSVSQWFLRRRPWRIRGIAFWCALHLELCRILWYHLHWHLPGVRPWNSRETVPPGMSVHTCAPGCVCLCVIEYAHCTQPAQGEDPFSHQIFTSNHRLPAACCYNAHTLPRYWRPMYSHKTAAHKVFEQSVFGDHFSGLCGSFSSVTATRLHLDTPNSHLSKSRPGCKVVSEEQIPRCGLTQKHVACSYAPRVASSRLFNILLFHTCHVFLWI